MLTKSYKESQYIKLKKTNSYMELMWRLLGPHLPRPCSPVSRGPRRCGCAEHNSQTPGPSCSHHTRQSTHHGQRPLLLVTCLSVLTECGDSILCHFRRLCCIFQRIFTPRSIYMNFSTSNTSQKLGTQFFSKLLGDGRRGDLIS